jgi:hypothetical protein
MKIYVAQQGFIDKYNSQDYVVAGYFEGKEDAIKYLQNHLDIDFRKLQSFHERNIWWWEERDEFDAPVVIAMISEEKLK